MNMQKSREQDGHFMNMALSLAREARREARPNPSVGAVLVKDGVVIGSGVHRVYGQSHGEILALEDARAKGHETVGASLYVTLEPCCHFGKTPPCTEAIIQAGIERVVIAAGDPNPLVAGKGVHRLREVGIEVLSGLFEAEAVTINKAFHHWIRTKRPYGILKAAMTLDGKIATENGLSQWITGEAARRQGHRLRAEAMAIVIGANTLRADDPELSARYDFENEDQPIRVVLSSHLDLPQSAKLWDVTRQKTLVFTALRETDDRVKALVAKGVEVQSLETFSLESALIKLGQMKIDSVLYEGGSALYKSALDIKAVQEAHLFYGTKFMGSHTALSLFSGSDSPKSLEHLPSLDFASAELLGNDLYVKGQVNYGNGVV